MPLIELKNLKRHYEMESGTVKALDGIDLDIEEPEMEEAVAETEESVEEAKSED